MENDITITFRIQVPEASDLAPYLGKGIDLPTFGGRMSVRWNPNARVMSVAGLAHFGTFLANVGLFDRMAEDEPFVSTAPQLNFDMRWRVVIRYAFRLFLVPYPALRALVPIR